MVEAVIELSLTRTAIPSGEPVDLGVVVRNVGRGACTNLFGRFEMSGNLLLVGGSTGIRESRVAAGGSVEHHFTVRAHHEGTSRIAIVNFSFSDAAGVSRRIAGCAWTVDVLPAPPRSRPRSEPTVQNPARTGVFISYRRRDGEGMANFVYQGLRNAFGPQDVFLDRDAIVPGADFRRRLDDLLCRSVAMVVLVGPRWNPIRRATGERRISEADDYVRLEIRTALTAHTAIVPVRFEGASMPDAATLPPDIRDFAYLEACEIHSRGFGDDLNEVVSVVRRHCT